MNELDVYLRDVRQVPRLTSREKEDLVRRHGGGDQAATRLLVLIHLPLVVRIAKGYRGRGLDFLDLIQEGTLGLLKATAAFDSQRTGDLGKYAAKAIRGALRDALAEQAGPFRLPLVTAYQARRSGSSRRSAATLEAANRAQAMRPTDVHEGHRATQEGGLEELERSELAEQVQAVLKSLPDPDGSMAWLRHIDELTVHEIAREVNTSWQTVARRLRELSPTLRERLAVLA